MSGPATGAGRATFFFHGGHSRLADGQDVQAIAEVAAEKDFVAFGFTEHFQTPPMANTPDPVLDGQLALFDDYVSDVLTARKAHRFLLLGAEVEYIRGAFDWTRAQLAAWPFDYVVGSVHYLRLGDTDFLIDWERWRTEDAIRCAGSPEHLQIAYYQQVLELLEWNIASVIGHLDLIKMWLTPEEGARTPAIEAAVRRVLEAMRAAGVAMDINARGLVKPCKRIYPDDWILEEARRIGVRVTLGDDSHGADDVGRNLGVAIDAVVRAGYQHVWLVRPDGQLEPSPLTPR